MPQSFTKWNTMKTCALVFLFVFCYAECRKTYTRIDKNANIAFINMEGGGVVPSAKPNAPPTPTKPANPPPPSPAKPGPSVPVPTQKPAVAPVTPPQTPKPVAVTQKPQVQPKPVSPSPVTNPITTPGPGSVKQLITFYDSQGKASLIRPYSYSQAVKQG